MWLRKAVGPNERIDSGREPCGGAVPSAPKKALDPSGSRLASFMRTEIELVLVLHWRSWYTMRFRL
jgi:hypothetical protein